MTPKLIITVYDRQQRVFQVESLIPVEIGRQRPGGELVYSSLPQDSCLRLIVAPHLEDSVSRQHALIEIVGPEIACVWNKSETHPILGEDNAIVGPKQKREFKLPTLLTVGRRTLFLEVDKPQDVTLNSLPDAPRAPGSAYVAPAATIPPVFPVTDNPEGVTLIRWLKSVMEVLQVAATTESFYSTAARALVELGRFDGGRVLRWTAKGCETVAQFGLGVDAVSDTVLGKVRSDRRTYWQLPGEDAARAESLREIASVVAAPILDKKGEVIAVLYGDRRRDSGGKQITASEAILVELLACGVAAGMARVEQEKAAIAAVTRFEQFFTPALARRLASEPTLLEGKDRPVTVLFCDIRGFSAISGPLGAAGTVAWVGNVMSRLSDCVLAHQGVLVDYIGDELMAMWGAPDDQTAQATLACRAALDMLACLPELNARWQEKLGQPFSVGIGINSGSAHVGNTGSAIKFKYGPLGNTVNLSSRVQGATKFLKCNLLITGSTKAQLGPEFSPRRICRAKVVSIPDPVELFELALPGRFEWPQLRTGYEAALEAYEQGDFSTAARTIGNLVSHHTGDGPSLLLLSRAANFLVHGKPKDFDSVWLLPGK